MGCNDPQKTHHKLINMTRWDGLAPGRSKSLKPATKSRGFLSSTKNTFNKFSKAAKASTASHQLDLVLQNCSGSASFKVDKRIYVHSLQLDTNLNFNMDDEEQKKEIFVENLILRQKAFANSKNSEQFAAIKAEKINLIF